MSQMYCNPDVCPNCRYIGEDDSFCDETIEIVLAAWELTEAYMRDCPFSANNQQDRKQRKRGVREKLHGAEKVTGK